MLKLSDSLRFIIVGLSNTLISYGLFWLALNALPDIAAKATLAQALSYAGGIIWSFYWNRRWTFAAKQPAAQHGPARQAGKFLLLQILLLVFSSLIVGLLVDVLSFAATPSWLAVMFIVTLINYYLQKHWVFQSKSHSEVPAGCRH